MNKIIQGDSLEVLKTLESESVDCVVTSPPYWSLRDYGVKGQLGLEPTFQEYITKLCDIFDEVKRVLKKEGTCWVNLGDTYSGNKEGKTDNKVSDYLKETTTNLHKKKGSIPEKSLCQIPSHFAIEMARRGWILRNEIIWHKPNCMPSSVKDRFTVDFEKVFFFVKSKKYWFETQYDPYAPASDVRYRQALRAGKSYTTKEPYKTNTPYSGKYKRGTGSVASRGDDGRNRRTVWSINTKPLKDAHFATYPEALIEPMIKAGCPVGGIVLDPFFGAGTTGVVAVKQDKNYLGIELNAEYIKIAEKRINDIPRSLFDLSPTPVDPTHTK